ncbi:MAG: hypothetical protein LBT09_07830 [Planctomycetaceae bacterium]|nr:hypothetical protein [Planctomycetaceae bacterium]
MILFTGCVQSPPSGLPSLVPCIVRVTDKDKPVADISVTFLRLEGNGGWALNGITNSSGIAYARTIAGTFEKNGLPEGTYRITLNERIEVPAELINDDDPKSWEKQEKYRDEHRILPKIVSDPINTPLKLTVSGSKSEMTIDISTFR